MFSESCLLLMPEENKPVTNRGPNETMKRDPDQLEYSLRTSLPSNSAFSLRIGESDELGR